MFEMTVDRVFTMGDVFTVYGECNGLEKLKPGTIKNEAGKEYSFGIPLGKPLQTDNREITLQLIGKDIDLNALKGHKLIQ